MRGRWEAGFERALWGTRLMVLIAVVAAVLLALGALALATAEVVHVLALVGRMIAASGNESDTLHTYVVTGIVRAVDGYLLTAILLIFAFGLYELFVSRIDVAEDSEVAPRLLLIRSLDDLKDRLAKVVVLILVITFFQEALQLNYASALDLLYLALGTLFVGGALYLSSRHPPGEH